MTVVPIRLNREDARRLDLLVKMGVYRNRTEAIRTMIQAKAAEELSRYVLSERVLHALDELLQHEKRRGESALRILTRRTAQEIVEELRQ